MQSFADFQDFFLGELAVVRHHDLHVDRMVDEVAAVEERLVSGPEAKFERQFSDPVTRRVSDACRRCRPCGAA